MGEWDCLTVNPAAERGPSPPGKGMQPAVSDSSMAI